MEIRIDPPGWIEYEPVEGVKVKVKMLSFVEGLKLTDDIAKLDGASIFSAIGQKYFTDYVKEIEGLVVNDVPIKAPQQFLESSMGRGSILSEIYVATLGRFFELNTLSGGDSKNSDGPSEDEAAEEPIT